MVEANENIDTESFWVQKKDTFIKLKLWDDEKNQKFHRIKKTLELLSSFIFSKLSRGKEISLVIAKYMKEHAAADNSYSNQLKLQLNYLPSTTSQYSDPLKLSLSLLSQVQQSLSQSFRDLSTNIENIINTQIAKNLMDSEKTVSESSTLWSTSQLDLQNLVIKSEKLFKDYLLAFQSQESDISKRGYVSTCLWLIESKYLNSVEVVHKHLVSCAILVKSFWDLLNTVEVSRVKTLKDSISSFIKLHDSVFNIKAEDAWNLIQELESDKFEIEGILGADDMQGFRNEIGDGDFFDQIVMWKMSPAPRNLLVVKEGRIDRETAVFRVWRQSFGVLTFDGFLHIFNEDYRENFEPPINSCFVKRGNLIENEEMDFEIIEAKQFGILSKLAAPRRSVFKLHSLDEFLEWVKAIKQLVN